METFFRSRESSFFGTDPYDASSFFGTDPYDGKNQMSAEDLIQNLETQWDNDGFLDAVRRGKFEPDAASEFLKLLKSISISDEDLVPKRLLSLLWYLPSFLEWQKERVAEVSVGLGTTYESFVTEVQNVLEDVLGVP